MLFGSSGPQMLSVLNLRQIAESSINSHVQLWWSALFHHQAGC